MHNHLLFLHDIRVPATNNEAERLLRNYKRKQAQVVTFRSFESIDYLWQCMSVLVLMRLENPANIYDRVSRIFEEEGADKILDYYRASKGAFLCIQKNKRILHYGYIIKQSL